MIAYKKFVLNGSQFDTPLPFFSLFEAWFCSESEDVAKSRVKFRHNGKFSQRVYLQFLLNF